MSRENQRAFVQYPDLRSTTVKYDPCHNERKEAKEPCEGLSCNDCRVFLMSDRFLGDEFQRR